MTFLLDTDICVHFLRGNAVMRARLSQAGRENIAASIITLVELRYGAANSEDPVSNHAAIDHFMSGITVLGLDDSIALRFGEIKTELRRTGQLISDFDILIAATTLAHNLTLVTNNTGHFNRVPNLRFTNWLTS